MTKPALLQVGEGEHIGKVVLLVAAVCGHPADEVVRTEPILEIKTQAGDVLKGLGTVSTYLASSSSAAGLLGTSPEEKAQVRARRFRLDVSYALGRMKDSNWYSYRCKSG